jgi:hypothetical protein
VGSIYPHLQRPGILFDGLDAFLAHHPEAATRLVVRLVGTKCDDTLRTLLRDRPSAAVCEVLPKVASRHAVDLVRASDAVLAFSLVESHGLGTLSYPSKVFEAFGAKRRVLLIPSDGDWVDRLLKETGARRPTTRRVARVLLHVMANDSTGTLAPCGRPDALVAHVAAQARAPAAVLDRMIASPRQVS